MASSIRPASEPGIKNPYQISKIEAATRGLYQLFVDLRPFMRPGISGIQIARAVGSISSRMGLSCSLVGYHGFKDVCCINHGKILAHGIPSEQAFAAGELITIDLVLALQGWHADASWTYAIGDVAPETQEHRVRAWQASMAGAQAAEQGTHATALAVRKVLEQGDSYLLPQFAGHGIGRAIHEPPRMSYLSPEDLHLPSGSVFTIEPVLVRGGNHAHEAQQDSKGQWVMEPAPQVAQFEVMMVMEGSRARMLGMPQDWQKCKAPPF